MTNELNIGNIAGDFFKHLLTFQKPQYTLVSSKLDDVDKTGADRLHFNGNTGSEVAQQRPGCDGGKDPESEVGE